MRQDSLPLPGIIMAMVSVMALVSHTSMLKEPLENIIHGVLAGIILLSIFLPVRLNITGRSFFIISAIVILLFLIWIFITKESLDHTPRGSYTIFYRLALCFTTINILLAYKKREKRDTAILLALIFLVSIFSGFSPGPYYVHSLAIITLLVIFYCITAEQGSLTQKRSMGYWLRLSGFVIVLLGAAFALQRALHWSEVKVNTLFMMTLEVLSFSPAFSNESKITSVQELKGSNKVVMRIFSRITPSYLVGKVFNEYNIDDNTWRAQGKLRIIHPLQEGSVNQGIRMHFPRSEGNIFHLTQEEQLNDDLRQVKELLSVVITAVNTETLFAPRGSLFVMVNSENIRIDTPGVLYANLKNTRGEYNLAINPALLIKWGQEDISPYLQIPNGLSEKIVSLNREIIPGKDTPWNTCQTLLSFFHNNFRYGKASHSLSGKALLEDFLISTRQGHCEFFATAMTLLLRLNKIPARYINGFMVEEYNRIGGYYVVREKDAHAWVEAYVSEKGWITIDPTPPLGRTASHRSYIPPQIIELYDLVMLKIYSIKSRLLIGDIMGTLIFLAEGIKFLFLWVFSSPKRGAFLISFLVLFILFKKRKNQIMAILKKKIQEKKAYHELPEEYRVIGGLLREFERLLSAKKIRRAPEMTLVEFSRNIDTIQKEEQRIIQEFLKDYCILRYGKETAENQDIEELRKKLQIVKDTLRKYNPCSRKSKTLD